MNSKRLLRKSVVVLLLSLLCLISFAQSRTVSGVVSDNRGDPVIGANIKVVGQATLGTITDLDGRFTLSLPETAKQLEISFIGYRSETVNVVPGQTVNVTLQEDTEQLDEVVVIGYQTVRRRDLTGSVASVKGEAIAAAPVTNVAQALQGKLPGVNIISQDGRPDAEISIRVRGGGSISQSNDPLVLIDGIPGTIGDIPGDMVESIDVLKDASSTAIYGARGANGVILVTTKKGKEGKISVSYNGYAKFNTPTGYIDILDPYDYLVHKWGAADAYFGTSFTTPFQQLYGIGDYAVGGGINDYRYVKAYNLQKDVYNTSFSHNHDLSLTAGNDMTKVLFAFNYMDEDGMKLNSYNRRASVSLKLDQKISKSLNFNLDLRYTDRETMGSESTSSGYGSSISAAYRFRPIRVEDMKGDRKELNSAAFGEDMYVMNDLYNPVAVIKDHDDQTLKQSLRGTAGVNWNIIKDLNYRTELTLTRDYTQRKIWRGPTLFGASEKEYFDAEGNPTFAGDADYRKNDRWSMRWSNTLSYEITLKNIHRINLLAGQEVTNSGGTDMRIKGEKYPANFTKENAFAMISQYTSDFLMSSGVSTPNRILSYFGRANYSLMDKYMLTLTFRADGSSNFSPEHRWGYFPAAALAWRVSEELFMKNISWLDDLKLRISYGQVGNDAIDADKWAQLWGVKPIRAGYIPSITHNCPLTNWLLTKWPTVI
ncbi:MAG: SusC/RagA family TonB-linked outer membrane protein [Bacteroides sp.]|nr:SusC/RagA family TonB-linked outer membrane protein [Bacteroides sp.]